MSSTAPSPTALRVSSLSQSTPTAFLVKPDAKELARLAEVFELQALRKLSFEGSLQPVGAADWQLKGRLGATVVQPCVVTLEPVTTRVETQVMRVFVRDFADADEAEIEMPEDDSVERLGAWIDPAVVMEEELVLALPAYPRSEGAEAKTVRVTEPGKQAMTDEQARPFAGLAAFKDQLEAKDDD